MINYLNHNISRKARINKFKISLKPVSMSYSPSRSVVNKKDHISFEKQRNWGELARQSREKVRAM